LLNGHALFAYTFFVVTIFLALLRLLPSGCPKLTRDWLESHMISAAELKQVSHLHPLSLDHHWILLFLRTHLITKDPTSAIQPVFLENRIHVSPLSPGSKRLLL
jgi:hypothetical protein